MHAVSRVCCWNPGIEPQCCNKGPINSAMQKGTQNDPKHEPVTDLHDSMTILCPSFRENERLSLFIQQRKPPIGHRALLRKAVDPIQFHFLRRYDNPNPSETFPNTQRLFLQGSRWTSLASMSKPSFCLIFASSSTCQRTAQ